MIDFVVRYPSTQPNDGGRSDGDGPDNPGSGNSGGRTTDGGHPKLLDS